MGIIKCKNESKKMSAGDFSKFTMPKKIVAVDFDGTLCFNKYPFIENPNEPLLKFIREHRKEYIWILWTCREGKQLDFATEWLKEQGIEFDYVNENCPGQIAKYKSNTRKIAADYYIDNHAMDWERFINEQHSHNNDYN